MMNEIFVDAGLSQIFTNHCVRSTAVTVLDEGGIPIHRIMQTSGHRNPNSVQLYCDRQTLEKEKQCSDVLAKACFTNTEDENTSLKLVQVTNQVSNNKSIVANLTNSPTTSFFTGTEFNNCHIVFNFNKS